MNEMIEAEDSCVYCSKYLFGLNDFNKKMHYNTCKVRKLVESTYPDSTGTTSSSSDSNTNDLDDFIILGNNCTYCFKSFDDFKNDFNKRIHLKCCKLKKQIFENKQNLTNKLVQSSQQSQSAQQAQSQQQQQQIENQSQLGQPTNSQTQNPLGESCIFCAKPLENLNDFNKKMHLENCKIRKSIEGNFHTTKSNKKNKDEQFQKLSLELGTQCMYCSKSFTNLSNFNKKLHLEHCKTKKRKLNSLNQTNNTSLNTPNTHTTNINTSFNQTINQTLNETNPNILLISTSCPNTPIVSSQTLNLTQNSPGINQQLNHKLSLNLDDTCMFCSRSLSNLSNFNKKVHIETCKIKQIKKATANQMKQANKVIRKRTNSNVNLSNIKKEKKSNQNEFCTTQIMTLDLSGANGIDATSHNTSNSANNTNDLNSNNNNNNTNTANSNTNTGQMTQFDTTNATILNLNSLDSATLHQINLAATNQANNSNLGTHTLQITLDPNTNRIYI